jgi:hypothetical protein
MTQEKFKLPRSSYEELAKIIKAYGRRRDPATLSDINQASGVSPSIISHNNRFLSAVNIIEGGKEKKATDEKGIELGRALEHNVQEDITKAWQTIVKDNDFLSKMVQAVQIRKGMEISSLISHIAYSAGESKLPGVMTGARTVIKILLESGLVKEDNDRIIPADIATIEKIVRSTEKEYSSPVTKVPITRIFTPAGLSVNIDLRIVAKPSELQGLGEKLKELIKTLSSSIPEGEKSDENTQQEG